MFDGSVRRSEAWICSLPFVHSFFVMEVWLHKLVRSLFVFLPCVRFGGKDKNMAYNSAREEKRFKMMWRKLRKEYKAAGMSEEAIEEMYRFDWDVFNRDRAFYRRRHDPLVSKGDYSDWLGSEKKPSYQEQLRRIIDTVLDEKPKDFADFLKRLSAYGVTVNTDRKNLRLKAVGQTKFTRCNSLKGDYTEQAIRERIEGVRVVDSKQKVKRPTVPKVGLLIDIDAAIRAGKGPGYERWAKVFNLKQLSQAVLYLKEHGDMSYEDLKEKTAVAVTRFNNLSAEIKDLESQMSDNAELQKQIINYAKTRAVYADYRKSGYSKKFRAEHETEILLHQAAKKYFDSLGDKKLPHVRALREQYQVLLAQKRKAYSAYKQAREEMKELYNVKSNVEHLLNISEHDTEREREKTRR